ncbi:hypothetical protein BDF14DRAFT_1722487 [Spinellus fusiger]|nr:hypothetical protein BDF14DRAFT_1722487 [Spinellus fusiger]
MRGRAPPPPPRSAIPEPPLTEAGRWTFHSQQELPAPPLFEKRLRRYPTGAETGCSIPLDLSHLLARHS